MAWRHIQKPQVVKCTRALVKEFVDMEPAGGDRNFRNANGQSIRSAIQEGRFRVADFASAKCLEDGFVYRVNGKHTSMVLSEMNGEFPSDLSAVVERYECDTLSDIASLYATFDPRSSARNTNDINRSYAACSPLLCDIPCRIVNLCASGIAYATWEDAMFNKSPELRSQLMVDNAAFVVWMYDLFSAGEWKHLKRAGVIAACFKTYAKSQKASQEFWSLVRDGSGSNHRSPDRVLNKFLLTSRVRGQANHAATETTRSMMVKSLHAWNAWRRGEQTDLKFYPKAKTPPAL